MSLLLIGWVAPPAAPEQAGRLFENRTAGISLTGPPGWHAAPVEEFAATRKSVRLADKDLQELLQKQDSFPLFVLTKYPEPHEGLNPQIQVTMRPLGGFAGHPPEDIMRTMAVLMQKAFPDFAIVEDVGKTRVSTLDAARLKAKYTLTAGDGASVKVMSRMCVVPRGEFLFLIAMNGTQRGPDVAEAEFGAAMTSLRIEK
jgi:hypothetical protein